MSYNLGSVNCLRQTLVITPNQNIVRGHFIKTVGAKHKGDIYISHLKQRFCSDQPLPKQLLREGKYKA